jgi:hypothetical protein
MSYNFSDEDKVETNTEFTDRLPFGVNDVQLVGATASETEAGKDFIELTVTNADGIEESARVWFTGGASQYSFNTIKQIVVHNAKTEADKEKARQAVENCKDTDEMADLLNSKCVGGQLWVTKYYDPARTYTNTNGQKRRSINTNIYGYAPKVNEQLLALTQLGEDTVVPMDGEDVTGKVDIPGDWS